ncbi:helix-turn-helix transcriptional regulator [Nitratireductor mangrovi]|uniref:Helix-turn-helix transcriptional regulator n=1 Tax=Nitratireductor mangrovi TaxID=2599600 RepID=A0A5B8L1E2_9HYPH|nr:LuxR family transcriptional regulator [Nitratireductor mangrovi]QDZ01338.1 helix-turn-helix transcriptional regulator [Nitratireductor mangrovi]
MSPNPLEAIQAARAAYGRGAWADAAEFYLKADAESELRTDDLEALVWAAAISARDRVMIEGLERLYARHAAGGNHVECARTAFWCGLRNMMTGEVGLGSGWLQRAARHAEQTAPDCVQRGYLLLPGVYMHRGKGDYETAIDMADRAIAIGESGGDPDLIAMAGSLKGGMLFRLGRIDEGYVPIDEAMLLASSQRLSPVVCGVVYCEIVASCCRVLEMVRAREWTAILSDWCRRNPQAKAFNGVCQVHRAEVLQLEGNWAEAFAEAERAGDGLTGTTEHTAMANAAYRRGEILRLRGAYDRSDAEYRLAGEIGVDPQPGLALLRLAQGRREDAVAGIRRALEAAGDLPRKAALLPAGIEIFIACGDLDEAARLCGEMSEIAERFGTEILARVADQGHATLALARGRFGDALPALTRARRYWSEFGAPYLVARLRADIAHACAQLGDAESAEREFDAAGKIFEELGAEPDLARILELRTASKAAADGLTARERQVLALVAEGGTNRAIADELDLSPKTVNRHIENIFGKLGVSSRAAAVAKGLQSGSIGARGHG